MKAGEAKVAVSLRQNRSGVSENSATERVKE